MESIIVAFRSRAHTVKFSNFLGGYGITNRIVNTPKEAGVGCGLSVEISKTALYTVKNMVNAVKLSSFAGFFLVKEVHGRRIVKSI